MTKKIVVMAIVVFSVMFSIDAMLVKALKQPVSKEFQQQRFYGHKKTSQKKNNDLSWKRDQLFYDVIQLDDVAMAGLLLKKHKRLRGDHSDIENAQSLKMVRLLEKYGCNIRKIDDGHGGNYLHQVIRDEGTNNTKIIKDSFIKYAIDKGVDPHAVNNFCETLWHQLLSRPFDFNSEEDHLLRRAKLLHSLNVSPDHTDSTDRPAIYLVLDKINDWEDRYKRASHSDRMSKEEQQEYIISELKICRKLLTIMTGEDFNKKSNRE